MRMVLILAIVVFAFASPSHAITRHVPGEYATIGAALAASAAGDSVLVACGTYFENELRLPPGVVLRSETGDRDCVTIDAQGTGRVIFADQSDTGALMEGLTLTNGADGFGAGMHCSNGASPTIRNCRFLANSGIGFAAIDCSPTFTDCDFRENTPLGAWLSGTGPITPRITGCRFESNHGTSITGGLFISHDADVLIDRCTFWRNQNENSGGAGLYINNGAGTISNCVFFENETTGHDYGGGGALLLYADVSIISSTFVGNSAGEGSALMVGDEAHAQLRQCVFAFNHIAQDAVFCRGETHLECCDIFGNDHRQWEASCLQPERGINGNFEDDPRFCDVATGDLTLRSDSPCLPGQHPRGDDCGLIGALGLGCTGPTATEPVSWGRVKATLSR